MIGKKYKIWCWLSLILLIVTLFGCAKPSMVIKLNAKQQLNPDSNNQALPVQLVIYQLRDAQVFQQATFMELWQDDQATLGASLVSREEVNVIPGSKTKVELQRENTANYIGIMAIFRNPNLGRWRVIKKIGHQAPILHKTIKVQLSGNEILLQ